MEPSIGDCILSHIEEVQYRCSLIALNGQPKKRFWFFYIVFFLFRGLLILFGLPEALQRKHCHSYWWTIWWDAFNQSLGPNHLTWFPASTWRDFSLCVTCSAAKLARSHGLINCLVTCSTARRVLWGGNGVYKLDESKIHRLEWHVI